MSPKNRTWRIHARILKGCPLFSRPHKRYPFSKAKRCKAVPSRDIIYVCVFNDVEDYPDAEDYNIHADYLFKLDQEKRQLIQTASPWNQDGWSSSSAIAKKRRQKANRKDRHLKAEC